MPAKFRSVKGMRDLLPPETAVWSAVESTARRIFASYGYGEIRTPLLEETELFLRSVGESTDIVGKQMYTFLDKKGKSLTLRPENTAPVARAFVEHGLQSWPTPIRLFYVGPQFRYERPQSERYRQFHQIGAELLGDPGPFTDGEIVLMLVRFLRELGFEDLLVLVNTVGDRQDRAAYGAALREFLLPHRSALGEDSRRRLETNPLRILDTKVAAERELLEKAPQIEGFLGVESRDHFRQFQDILEDAHVGYRVDAKLVRGLDYYTRTVFEIVSGKLGAQNAIVGGGRYDGLIAELGGPEVPAIGFAIGQDRLLSVLPDTFRRSAQPDPPVMVVRVGEVSLREILTLAEELRRQGVGAVTEGTERSLKSALKRAHRMGLRWVALLGDEEVSAGEVTLRNLESGSQRRVVRSELALRLKEGQ